MIVRLFNKLISTDFLIEIGWDLEVDYYPSYTGDKLRNKLVLKLVYLNNTTLTIPTGLAFNDVRGVEDLIKEHWPNETLNKLEQALQFLSAKQMQ